MHWDGWWHFGWMWVFWILLIVALVLLIRWAVTAGRSSRPPGESPEAILKQRYARGEIDKEEYDRRLTDLRR